MYSESLGRWRTADLLIGLAYLARREGEEHPVADIAANAQPIGLGHADAPQQAHVLVCLYAVISTLLAWMLVTGSSHQAR